ncbi:MAG TPA: hypothetical protein VNO70_17600 [Blastocatellia bacterium]|nr:hypothetical protein [Blastocatellia bacterium]
MALPEVAETVADKERQAVAGFFASRNGALAVTAVAAVLSVVSFLYFFSNGMTNLYGDGIAHVNIARKVVDHPDSSFWQRYIQIGSPWLPLQTAAMLPFVANDWMWRTGVAGSIVSMIAFVIAAAALYLHSRHLYRKEDGNYKVTLPPLTAGIYLLNPSALFMQATPMSELIFMAALATGVYLLQSWAAYQTSKRLILAAAALTLATLARYEAWPVAALAVGVVAFAASGTLPTKLKRAAIFAAVVSAGPLYWLWHNWAIYGDALWFLTGPHSARGIYLQNRANLGWSNIFVGNALLDFGLMFITVAACVGIAVAFLGVIGLARFLVVKRREVVENLPALLLVVPFFFHVLSLYRGEIQIFPLSAFGLLNVRYGLPHLLALALFAPLVVPMLGRFGRRRAIAIVCSIIIVQYGYLVADGAAQLAVYQEGYRNGVNAKPARQWARLAAHLREHPPPAKILMDTGALGPVVPRGGLRFADIIHEGTTGWHGITDTIPGEISTIILQEGDPLDRRLRENPALTTALARDFQERFSTGKAKVFQRR